MPSALIFHTLSNCIRCASFNSHTASHAGGFILVFAISLVIVLIPYSPSWLRERSYTVQREGASEFLSLKGYSDAHASVDPDGPAHLDPHSLAGPRF
jgi:predicted lipase